MITVNEHHCVPIVPIFQKLTAEQTDQVEALVQHQHLKPGDFLYHEGDVVNQLSIIAHGQVKVAKVARNGKEQLLYLLQTGDIQGETALFNRDVHTSDAQALTNVAVCSINRSDFQHLIEKYPQISINVLAALGQRLAQLEKQATMANTESVPSRLANYLVETSASLGQATFKLPIKQKDLAAWLGTTPETISRLLKKWATTGLIQRDHQKITITDSEQLLLI